MKLLFCMHWWHLNAFQIRSSEDIKRFFFFHRWICTALVFFQIVFGMLLNSLVHFNTVDHKLKKCLVHAIFRCKCFVSFCLYSDEATVISGTKLAKEVLKEVQRDVESWISFGNKRPHLTVVLVGDNPASHIYVRNKVKAAAAVGMYYII